MVLDALAHADPNSPLWGYKLTELTGLGSGTIYPIMERLETGKYVSAKVEMPRPADRPPRRFYELTGTGRQLAADAQAAGKRRADAWSPRLAGQVRREAPGQHTRRATQQEGSPRHRDHGGHPPRPRLHGSRHGHARSWAGCIPHRYRRDVSLRANPRDRRRCVRDRRHGKPGGRRAARVLILALAALAGRIAGRRHAHLRDAWAADLCGDPEAAGDPPSAHRRMQLAEGFVVAALRCRLDDVVALAWQPVDTLLGSWRGSQTAICLPATVAVGLILSREGLYGLISNAENLAVIAAAPYAAIKGLRKYRKIDIPKRPEKKRTEETEKKTPPGGAPGQRPEEGRTRDRRAARRRPKRCVRFCSGIRLGLELL